MANHKSAFKRIRNSERKRLRNRLIVSRSRTDLKTARVEIAGGDLEAARAATVEAIRTMDKAASKGIIHLNNAARHKSRLMKRLAALEATGGVIAEKPVKGAKVAKPAKTAKAAKK